MADSTMPTLAGNMTVNIGTRKSPLALKQTDEIIAMLKSHHPTIDCQIHTLSVLGDRDKTTALAAIGGKGLWTNELEAQLVSGQLDMVVHSLKDMPTTLPDGCTLGAVPAREDARDVVVLRKGTEDKYKGLSDLPAGSVVGTSSVRRSAQLKRRFPSLKFTDVRGNIDTRLRKCDDPEGPFAAIILAAAGLNRMGFTGRISEYLDAEKGVLHAVGQGGLGIEVRKGDERVLGLIKPIIHEDTALATAAERTLMRTLEGGCSVPIGVQTSWVGDRAARQLRLRATVVNLEGTEAVDADMTSEVSNFDQGEAFGKKVAADLVNRGASKILDVINATREPKGPIGE
ncbi:Porphobilinogen deaminase [Zalerion maritima]|uniref:Porphobilinogen deaminase n=1 Tax=Zalerion maritima TaxID=339359 RepID=A0AAD5WUC3_9PEZI|nr:Porphobilinogen deaminase [Zalerion maritima]